MARLTWEWSDRPDAILVKKARGKLTVGEIRAFLDEREQISAFGEGALCVIAWRNRQDAYSGWEPFERAEGDSAEVFVLQDGSACFCGRLLQLQYCPGCGHRLSTPPYRIG